MFSVITVQKSFLEVVRTIVLEPDVEPPLWPVLADDPPAVISPETRAPHNRAPRAATT